MYISNYALIEELDVSFPGQLTVITGETGAGKSIFLEALGLALGNRADAGTLQKKDKKCIIEAEFDIRSYALNDFFTLNELDYDKHVLLRREITPEGKSRSFINDTPVNLSTVKQLADQLIDIHSQHQTLLLNQSKFQLQLVDSFAETVGDVESYKKEFARLLNGKQRLNALIDTEKQAKKDLDYFQFLFNELNEFDIDEERFKALESESETLENSEFIKSCLNNSAGLLGGGDENLLSGLSSIKQQLSGIAKFNASYKGLLDRITACYVELKDVLGELEGEDSNLVYDPAKLNEVNEKIDKINRLFKKHGVQTVDELMKIKEDVEQKLNQYGSLENDIQQLHKELDLLEKTCHKKAVEISKKRTKVLPDIEKKIHSTLSELSMPNAQFKIDLAQKSELNANGVDEIMFLFCANKGGEFKELHKVASGGEMSRLMLALKSSLAEKRSLPTIIFDEIDTGISGDVANKMGVIFNHMSKHMQVISITHLPQIASKGNHHLFVYKNDDSERTRSFIKSLTKEERIVEIAKMLSTGKPTESAIKNAKDLLGSN